MLISAMLIRVMSSSHRALSCFVLVSVILVAGVGCGQSKARSPYDEQVPANSASEARLHGDTRLQSDTTGGAGAVAAESTPKPTAPTATHDSNAKATGKISKAECNKVFDKYLDLEISKNPMLQGIDPADLAQIKAQTRAQGAAEHGDHCSTHEISRAAYNCAMAAQTPQAWQACMK
ncbi:MAG: hypothetical protein FWD73_03585 [Polyangiaceae bacterium]|nr:hypothetical protein [Polyangiaceae bacterium]